MTSVTVQVCSCGNMVDNDEIMIKRPVSYVPAKARLAFFEWLKSPLGNDLLLAERDKVQAVLDRVYACHVLQMGSVPGVSLSCQGRSVIAMNEPHVGHQDTQVIAYSDELPFSAGSLDAVVLWHVLEFVPDPYSVLREVSQCLDDDGDVIVVCFNPISVWGLWRWLLRKKGFWQARFLSAARVRDWFELLGYEFEEHHSVFFRPPSQRLKVLNRFEAMGQRWLSDFGAVNVFRVKKRTMMIAKPRLSWKTASEVLAPAKWMPETRPSNVQGQSKLLNRKETTEAS